MLFFYHVALHILQALVLDRQTTSASRLSGCLHPLCELQLKENNVRLNKRDAKNIKDGTLVCTEPIFETIAMSTSLRSLALKERGGEGRGNWSEPSPPSPPSRSLQFPLPSPSPESQATQATWVQVADPIKTLIARRLH